MPIYFLTTALLIVSILTNFTVEGIKKLLEGTKIKYSSNILAAVCAVILAFLVSGGYLIMNDLSFSLKTGIDIIILMYLSFLTSTIGYDKAVQMIKQLQEIKNE